MSGLNENLNPKDDIRFIANYLKNIHKISADFTEEIGYQLSVAKAVEPYWSEEPIAQMNNLQVSAAVVINNWRDEIDSLKGNIDSLERKVISLSDTASFVGQATGTISVIYPVKNFDIQNLNKITQQKNQTEIITNDLEKINASLSKTYATIWQYMRYPAFDPIRGPLYLMRQTFDNLLGKFATDEEVMLWKDFQPDKELEKRNGKGVTREQRIKYIANNKIKDPQSCSILISSADHFNKIYKSLNEAHKRGELNDDAAINAIYAGNSLLLKWIKVLI